MFCWPYCVMLAGMALYIHLLVYVGLSLFIISGLYVYMVVCIVYAYNLTTPPGHTVNHWPVCILLECIFVLSMQTHLYLI